MAEITYQYSISDDTATGNIDGSKLKLEIQNTSTILVSLNRIDTFGDTIYIIFNDSLDSGELSTLDTLVAIHDGIPVITSQTVRIQEATMAERQLSLKGIMFTANLDSDTSYDMFFTEDRELQIVNAYIKNHSDGDYIELSVHVPDSSDYMVGKFAETVYIPPDGRITPEPSFDTTTIPAYLLIRFTYHSTANSGPKPLIVAHLRTHK